MHLKRSLVLALQLGACLDNGMHDGVDEREDGAAEEEPEVSSNLAHETRVIAHLVLLLVREQEILEPDVNHPVRILVQEF